jgi:hypothetical protein
MKGKPARFTVMLVAVVRMLRAVDVALSRQLDRTGTVYRFLFVMGITK